MKTFKIAVTQYVTVVIDFAKFAPRMPDFNACISDFGDDEDALDRHAEHIAELAAGGIDFDQSDFVEGYGLIRDAGIKVAVANHVDCELLSGAE